MNHDPETLASAYLDGDLTDEERRLAEADPSVMAEVDELRALRVHLADVEPPSDAARESAIGAAMAAFHDQFGTRPAVAGPPVTPVDDVDHGDAVVVPFRRKVLRPQWLGVAAAAVVAIVAVGVVGTRFSGGDDDDSFDMATDDAAEEQASEPAMATAEEPADEPAEAPAMESERIAESEMADDVFATDAVEEAAEEPADGDAGDEMSADMADEPASGGTDDLLDGLPPLDDPGLHFDDDVPILGRLQLRAAAWWLLEQRDDGTLGATPEYQCEFFNVLAVADYDVDGEFREVLIEVDEIDRLVLAVDRDDCLIVAAVELDEP